MDVKAITKYSRMSPSKVGEVTRMIQGLSASRALEVLRFVPRKSARMVEKTLKSAIANATNNAKLAADSLRVKEAVANEGPRLKRFQPKARGSAGPIIKRTSHIQIILTDGQ
jgi:large subunit ribosomal protein L22